MMGFGIMDMIGLVGSVANSLSNQSTATTQSTQTALTKDDFKSMFLEAMNEYDSASPQTDEEMKEKLNLLFTYIDTNKDGAISKDEFSHLKGLLNRRGFHI